LSTLSPAGDLQAVSSFQGRHVDLGAQGGLGKADGNLAIQIVAPPFEKRMVLDQNLHAEVAARRPRIAQLALVALLQPHAAPDPRRHVDLKPDGGRYPAGAAAFRTGVGDPHALSAAGGARGADLEEPARLDDLAPAAAVVAGRRRRPLARSGTLTFPAKVLAVDLNGPRRPPRRLDQLDFHLQDQVGARTRTPPPTP